MAKNQAAENAETPLTEYFFPELGKTVYAATLEEAQAKANLSDNTNA